MQKVKVDFSHFTIFALTSYRTFKIFFILFYISYSVSLLGLGIRNILIRIQNRAQQFANSDPDTM